MNKHSNIPALFQEKNRPQVHFTPKVNWLNDPNGMVYYAGKYHLFYQYNPGDKVWGDMNWGHAVSEDLIHWQHRRPAIMSDADGHGYIFSGCAVVDWHNTTGLQDGEHPPLVALFTHSNRYDQQKQSAAYSLDGGDNWHVYSKNPIIENPNIPDFRDPKVIWHTPSQAWIMTLAAGQKIMFYRSHNLLDWEYLSDFGSGYGAHGGVWECPDFFPLKIEGSDEEKWVLLVSINPGGPNKGSATQYFIGEFDGTAFRHQHVEILWMDYGPDCYAGVTWSDIPEEDGRRILIAWMTNWSYANHQPTAPWRGAMTIPRELSLIQTSHGLRLSSKPVAEIAQIRSGQNICFDNLTVVGMEHLDNEQPISDCLEMHLSLDWSKDRTDEWILRFYNAQEEELLVDFKASINELRIDRSKANFRLQQNADFNRNITAPIDLEGQLKMDLIIIKDSSSIEVFAANGVSLITASFFVDSPLDRIELHSGNAELPLELTSAKIYALNSIWS
jgi:fructan beta-fructosidase